jgi:hypothetical protein
MAKEKDFSVSIPKEKIMYSNISKSKDGYNSARVVAKLGDNEYMSISYEWEGSGVPPFAIDLMGYMKANEIKPGVIEGQEESYEEFSKKKCKPKGK